MFKILLSFLFIGWCVNDVNEMSDDSFPIYGEIVGFAHQDSKGAWFLTDSPVLKSCCQAAPDADEVVFINKAEGLQEKSFYHFEGSVKKNQEIKEFFGKKVSGGEKGFVHLLGIFIGAAILSYLFAKRWKK
jgi:hypothetical protein